MPQIVTIGSGGDYSTVASWVASSDYSTDWGAGNPATGRITGKITETATINTTQTPNGALLTALPGEEYDGTNSSTCAGLTSSGITLALRDDGLEVSDIFIETTANTIALRAGAFEAVDSNIHDIGLKAGLTGNESAGIETYASAPFTGNLERIVVEGSGGWGIRLRNNATGTLDHWTLVDVCSNGSGFRDGVVASGSSATITNALVILASTASGSAESFSGTFNASSDYNAGDDTTAPGVNSLDNRTTADLVNYAGGDFRTASASPLATAGGSGGFIGAFLESGGGGISGSLNTLLSFNTQVGVGILGQSVLGSCSVALEPNLLTSSGVLGTSILGALNVTGDGVLLQGVGTQGQGITGSGIMLLDGVSLTSLGTVGEIISGSLDTLTLPNELNALGMIGTNVSGLLNVTLEDNTSNGVGVIGQAIVGNLNVNLSPNTLIGTGVIGEITGTLNVVHEDNTLASYGFIVRVAFKEGDISLSSFYDLEDLNISLSISLNDINLKGV